MKRNTTGQLTLLQFVTEDCCSSQETIDDTHWWIAAQYFDSKLGCDWMGRELSGEVGQSNHRRHLAPRQHVSQLGR